MGQDPPSLDDAMPCPDCGCQHLIQHAMTSENVHVNKEGEIDHIEARDSFDVQELMCPECDKTIWER